MIARDDSRRGEKRRDCRASQRRARRRERNLTNKESDDATDEGDHNRARRTRAAVKRGKTDRDGDEDRQRMGCKREQQPTKEAEADKLNTMPKASMEVLRANSRTVTPPPPP